MKALSIKQPWASLICTPRKDDPTKGIKDIENRTWRTHFRGRIYIHASQTPQSGLYKEFIPSWMELSESQRREVVHTSQFRGAIIGEVDIVDCVLNHESIWAEKMIPRPDINDYRNEEGGNIELFKANQELYKNQKPIWNWVLANPVLYEEPILNVKGKLSFWEYEPCKHPRSDRVYIGSNLLRCTMCGTEFS